MRRFIRTIIVLVVVIGIVIAAGVAAILLLPETDLVRASVQNELTKLTGQKVSLGSLQVKLAFPKLVHLKLEGISVHNPEGEELFAADRIVLSPSLGALLKRRLDIDSVVVERFRTAIVRAADGRVRDPFMPIAVPRHSIEDKPSTPPEARQTSPEVTGKAEVHPAPVNWSLRRFQLTDGQVNWVDRSVTPGKEVRISVTDLSADLTQPGPNAPVTVKATGKLTAADAGGSKILIDGSLVASPDRTTLESATLSFSADPLELQAFRVYVSDWAFEGGFLAPVALSGQCVWQKTGPPAVDFSLSAKQKTESASTIGLEGKYLLPSESLPNGRLTFTATTDAMPLNMFRSFFPRSFPLKPNPGIVKGTVKGQRTDAEDWSADGKLTLQNVEPLPPYNVIGKTIQATVEAGLTPEALTIANAEIAGPARVATAKGQVRKPLNADREFDLTADAMATSALARAFGVKLPDELVIDSGIPLRGRISGSEKKVTFDLTGDLTGTRVAFAPLVDKPRGQKGSVAAKGTVLPPAKGTGSPKIDAAVSLNASGVSVRPAAGAGLTGLVLTTKSQISGDGGKVDLKNVQLQLGRPGQKPNILAATGNITGVGPSEPRINAAIDANVGPEVMQAIGVPASGEIVVKGTIPVSGKVNGAPSALVWTVEAPLKGVEIEVKDVFRKPAGMESSARASLQTAGREVKLLSGRITLPGASVNAQGLLSDRKGDFGKVTLETNGAKLERLLALFPNHKGLPITGQANATVHLVKTESGLGQAASVQLAGVNFRPAGADLALEQINGNIDLNGDSVDIPQISGRFTGLVQAPVSLKGSLKKIGSPATMNGDLNLDAGKGRIKGESVLGWISQARTLARGLVSPPKSGTTDDFRDFNYLKGDVKIASGTATSNNIRLKGADITLGAMGSVTLESGRLKDMLVAVRTDLPEVKALGETLGKIGPVRDLIERNRGLLNAMGIKLPRQTEGQGPGAAPVPTLQTVIMRLNGPIANPQKAIVLEASLPRETAARLKDLLE